jgi:hypothetical protein
LTPKFGVAIAIVLLAMSIALGLAAALWQPLRASYAAWRERRLDETGWLPASEEVTGLLVDFPQANANGELRWRTYEYPCEVSAAILDCLVRREQPSYPSRPRTPLQNDFDLIVGIRMEVPQRRQPVRIGLMRSQEVWIGSKVFRISASDSKKLRELLNDKFYLAKLKPPPAP